MMQHSMNYPAQHAELPQAKMKPRKQTRKKARGEGASSEQKKRRLTSEQARFLELSFRSEQKLESARKDRLAAAVGLDPRQVAVWFQNRRVRWKSKQLENEYMRLKKEHESMVTEKYMLEEEVLKLRGQLSAAMQELNKISECDNLVRQDERSCIPSSSISMYATDNVFGDLWDDLLHTPEYTFYNING